MNLLQEIFLVSFSILYGIMLNACLGLGLFHFGYLFKHMQRNVLRRIVVSLFVINILPFFYFAGIYLWIGAVAKEIALDALNPQNILSIVSVFLLSISVFGFYRFFHLLILIKEGRWLYDLEHFAQSERVWYAVPERVRKIVRMRVSAKGTSMGVLLYFLLAFIGYLFLTLNFVL